MVGDSEMIIGAGDPDRMGVALREGAGADDRVAEPLQAGDGLGETYRGLE